MWKKSINLVGERFARLTVIRRAGTQHGHSTWECLCDCGTLSVVASPNLRSGSTRTCGCSKTDKRRPDRWTRAYKIWAGMRQRCKCTTNKAWLSYGGRGISVCDQWESFDVFLADMGQPPEGYSIDRIDVNGNYEPDNCRWATQHQQVNNCRRSVVISSLYGRHTIKEFAAIFGLKRSFVSTNVYRGKTNIRGIKIKVDRPNAVNQQSKMVKSC